VGSDGWAGDVLLRQHTEPPRAGGGGDAHAHLHSDACTPVYMAVIHGCLGTHSIDNVLATRGTGHSLLITSSQLIDNVMPTRVGCA
jgi:hypothetical protein